RHLLRHRARLASAAGRRHQWRFRRSHDALDLWRAVLRPADRGDDRGCLDPLSKRHARAGGVRRRFIGTSGVHVRCSHRAGQNRRVYARRFPGRVRRPALDLHYLFRRGARRARRRLHAQFNRGLGDRRHLPVRGFGRRRGLCVRCLRDANGGRSAHRFQHQSGASAAFRRPGPAIRDQSRLAAPAARSQQARPLSLTHAMVRSLPKIDVATLIAFGCIVLLLLLGAAAKPGLLSVDYLVQQLQVASFLGVIATGEMIVILMGQIDLSIPWTISMGGMMATGAVGIFGPTLGVPLAIPFGIFCGLMVGLINGLGVAYLRAPSMIFTLGMNAVAQGLMVYHTGGFAPQDRATELMVAIASGQLIRGLPNPLLIWIVLGAATT